MSTSNARNMRRIAAKGVSWSQRQEGDCAVITIRLPTVAMPPASYIGREASDRVRRFAVGFLSGLQNGTRELGGKPDPLIDTLLANFGSEHEEHEA